MTERPGNVVLDDDVKRDLDRRVDSGMRSRVVNRALRREILSAGCLLFL